MVAPLGTCGSGQPCSRGNGMDMDQQSGLAWFDLESAATGDINNLAASLKGTAWNWIYAPATGLYAAAPSLSHDGTQVLFTMTDKVKSGRLGTSANAHLYTVPYSKTAAAGGDAGPRRRVRGRARAVLRRAVGRRQVRSPTTSWTRPRRTTSTRRWIRWTSMRA